MGEGGGGDEALLFQNSCGKLKNFLGFLTLILQFSIILFWITCKGTGKLTQTKWRRGGSSKEIWGNLLQEKGAGSRKAWRTNAHFCLWVSLCRRKIVFPPFMWDMVLSHPPHSGLLFWTLWTATAYSAPRELMLETAFTPWEIPACQAASWAHQPLVI